MTAWSPAEAMRTIDEVKRRSAMDLEFRTLALTNPLAALAKINPRPILEGSLRFVESVNPQRVSGDVHTVVVILPDYGAALDEDLSDEDLENAAGGGSPPVGIS